MPTTATCGRRGPDIRSDCWIELELRDTGGIDVQIKSKVDFMYGEANRKLIADTLAQLGADHCRITIEDTGALPFVLAARIETAVRRALPGRPVPEVLPEPGPSFNRPSARDCWRRSRLYLPGNEPRFFLNARIHRPDAVILDLEDSVPEPDKDAALILVRNALRGHDFGDCERMVRINQLPRGLAEVEPLVRAGVNLILIPKCENEDEVEAVSKFVDKTLKAEDAKRDVWLMPIIETCEGVFRARKIARASERIVGLTYGLEDYIANLGGIRTPEGLESLWARSQIVNAARSAGVQPIDTVFANVDDLGALAASCRAARELGFEGKGCIHPRQIPVVHEAFTPSAEEIDRARRIVNGFHEAQARGRSVVSVGSKMIDPPVVKQAQRIIAMAVACGCLKADWEREA
jgi:citrate lyase subunit beta/citryl-CoA lyase